MSRRAESRRGLRSLPPDKAVLVYALVGVLWILFSDALLFGWADLPQFGQQLSTVKGLAFVAVTSALLWVVLRHRERDLISHEELYRRAIAQAGAVAYRDDIRTGQYTHAGEGVRALTGLAPEEFTGERFRALVREVVMRGRCEGLSPAEARARLHRGDLPAWEADYRIVTRGGEEKWISDVAVTMHGAGGEVTGSLGILMDITDRKRVEQELRRSEERYRRLVEAVSVVPWEYDPAQSQFTYIAPQVTEIAGHTLEEWHRPRFWEEHLHPEDRAATARACGELSARGEDHTLEYRLLRPDGSAVWVRDIASVIPRAGQTPLLRGVLLDITAQRRADEALRALNERLSVQTEVAKATAGSMTPEELCDRLLAVVVEVMPADSFYVDRWNPETEQTKGIRNFDLVNGKLTPVPVLDVVLGHEGRLWSEVISGRRPLLIHRERAETREPGFVPFGETDRPSASLLYAPMIVSNRLVGVMSVQSYRPQAYTQRHVDLLMAIAQQAAPALEATLLAERLRESEERHRLIFEHASEGIAMVDPEERYLWANTAHCVQMGVEPGGLMGRSLREFVDAETWERLTRETAKRRQGIVSRYELRIRQPGGAERLLFVSAIPIFGPDGAFQGTQGFLMDITERKRAEEERERLAKAVEQSAEIIIVTDANHVIEYVNPAFERITGYTAAEAIGQTPRLLQSPGQDAALAADLRATLARGDVWTGEFTDRCKDGSHVRLQVTISPVRDARGVVTNFVSVQRDVTRESEMADQLRQAQKMEAVGQLAGGVAHDFNNLLLAILGFTDMVIETLDEGDPRRADLREVQRAAERASSLTRQLLAFSRRQMLRPVDVDLGDVVADIVKMLRRVIGEHIELEIVRSEEPGRVNADPGQIQQVLINLCVNARDAMPSGGRIVIETGTVTLGMDFVKERGGTEAGRYVVLSVRDTGEGIPPDVLPRIFEPFFTTKGVGEGTGLGLATVYGIVAQHGGLVDVESPPGQGATFHVYLPEVESSSPAAAAEAPAIAGGTETILLAEDEQTVRALATRMLTRAGYRVLEAVNGVEAVRIASDPDVHIDMALLDVIMPAMGGREAHDRIAAVRPGIRFLFTSGYSPAGVIREFLDQPGRRLLLKPYSVTDLLGMVREVLDS